MSSVSRPSGGFISLIEILLVTAVILLITSFSLNSYWRKSSARLKPLDKDAKEAVLGEGINTSGPRTTVDSFREEIRQFELKQEERQRQLEDLN
jgi:hypothetical protein